MNNPLGIVLFGDVVRSRDVAGGSAEWLESLCVSLDRSYGSQALANFEFTQGDEIQGLLEPGADPFDAVLRATLQEHEGENAVPRMRWAVAFGEVEPGRGPATRRSGPAFILARETLEDVRRERDGLACRTQDARADALLDGTAPVLAAMIGTMTDRQRVVARHAVVDGQRQSDIAEELGVARATISVSFARGEVRNVGRLLGAVRTVWAEGVAATSARLDGAARSGAAAAGSQP